MEGLTNDLKDVSIEHEEGSRCTSTQKLQDKENSQIENPLRIQQVRQDHWGSYKLPPSQQKYANPNVEDIDPSEEELSDLSVACNKLWLIDFNRLIPGQDYEINLGDGKEAKSNKEDLADTNLFTWLKDDVLKNPTISRFSALLDNYDPQGRSKEVVTDEEKQEETAFIEEISRTAPIKYLYKYLRSKGVISGDYDEFKGKLIDLWFALYDEGGNAECSCAFEHVFVGEIKKKRVSGFHNWIQFYLEEAKGRVDYQGYILPEKNGETPGSETQLLDIQFKWNGIRKPKSSSFIGVSPEFEMALYTLCFFVGEEENHVKLGPYQVTIICFRHGDKIGTAFPVVASS